MERHVRAALQLLMAAWIVQVADSVLDRTAETYIFGLFAHEGSGKRAEDLLELYERISVSVGIGLDVLALIALASLGNAARGPARGLVWGAFGCAVGSLLVDAVYYVQQLRPHHELMSFHWYDRVWLASAVLAVTGAALVIVALFKLGAELRARVPIWIGALAAVPLAWQLGLQLWRFSGHRQIHFQATHPWTWAAIGIGFTAWLGACVITLLAIEVRATRAR